MPALFLLLKTSRTAQIVGLVSAALLAFGIWLFIHDRSVRREALERIERQAQEQAAEATNTADEAQETRNEAYEASRVDNASDVGDYLRQLRANQCRANPAACGKTDMR